MLILNNNFALLFLYVLLISSNSAFSGEQREAPIVIAVIEVGEPAAYKNVANKPTGYLYDISKAIIDKLDIPNSRASLVPLRRVIHGLKHGDYHCSILLTNKSRENDFLQLSPIMYKNLVIVSRLDSDSPIAGIEDLKGLKVGHLRGAFFLNQENFSFLEHTARYPVGDSKNGLKMLNAGRIDAFIGTRDFMDKHYSTNLTYSPLSTQESRLQCSKNSKVITPNLVVELKRIISELHKTNVIFNIIRRYRPFYERNNGEKTP